MLHTTTPSLVYPDFQKEVIRRQKSTKLDTKQVIALQAVARWKITLDGTNEETPLADRKLYLTTMGYVTDKSILSAAIRSNNNGNLSSEYKSIVEKIISGKLDAKTIADSDPDEFRKDHPRLSISQVKLLQDISAHQDAMSNIDLSSLKGFPFPITKHNFFGRFIASGCDEPHKAVRHLALCAPFLFKFKSLVEGLALNKDSFLVIDRFSSSELIQQDRDKDNENQENDNEFEQMNLDDNHFMEVIYSLLGSLNDFQTEDRDTYHKKSIACIHIPRLPTASTTHIEDKERNQLAIELYDWLFFGNKDGHLLNIRRLSTYEEEFHKKDQIKLKRLERELVKLRKNDPRVQREPKDPKRRRSLRDSIKRYETKLDTLPDEIAKLKESIKEANRKRLKQRTILQEIESDPTIIRKIQSIRQDIANALKDGSKICLSFLEHKPAIKKETHNQNPTNENIFLTHLDKAYACSASVKSPGAKVLKNASCLFTSEAKTFINLFRVPGFGSLTEQQFRDFEIDDDSINDSIQYLISDILPNKINPKISLLADFIVSEIDLPGINSTKQLNRQIAFAIGKSEIQKPTIEDYLLYVFERANEINLNDLYNLLDLLLSFEINKIPDECIVLAETRFNIPKKIFDDYARFRSLYKPDKIGYLPNIFQDLATLETFTSNHLDSFGMSQEVSQICELLKDHNIVTVVDSTNYHPSFITQVMDEKVKSDKEETPEVWGEYVRPAQRLINCFARNLMEGNVPENIRDCSLIAVRKPNRNEKAKELAIKKIFGIDIGEATDVTAINAKFAALTIYDGNSILVIDAESIKDNKQFDDLVKLLEKFKIKVVIRSRVPRPGLPQVLIQPISDNDLPNRLEPEAESLRLKLGLEQIITNDVLRLASDRICDLRQPDDDPLNMALQIIHGAAQNALLSGFKAISSQDIVAAIPSVFHLPDAVKIINHVAVIDSFIDRAPGIVLGQTESINLIGDLIKQHLLMLRDPRRPLSIMIPGPTGVGKTEFLMKMAQVANLPFFMIEGSMFSEDHTISRLIGSPAGYKGPDEGVLVKFAKDNEIAIVFIDEIEKMNPAVYTAFLNWFDRGSLISGTGETVTRPAFIIVAATNAGAEKLTRNMSQREVRDLLATEFCDREGRKKPELVRRFAQAPMFPISESDFQRVIANSLQAAGSRFGFINANLKLNRIDDMATSIIFEDASNICKVTDTKLTGTNGLGFATHNPNSTIGDQFFDMRYVNQAIQAKVGESLGKIVIDQYRNRAHISRTPRLVDFIGDKSSNRVIVTDSK